jgi:hypothetical protein
LWQDGDFAADRAACLERLQELIETSRESEEAHPDP